jgi:hypothetical protein
MVLQLLDKNQRVIAQKIIVDPYATKCTLTFTKYDVELPLKLLKVVPGTKIMFENGAFRSAFLWTRGGINPWVNWNGSEAGLDSITETYNSHIIPHASWIVRMGPTTDSVMFENVHHPGRFLIERYGRLVYLPLSSGELGYKDGWKIVPALNGAPGWVSVVNVRSPGLYWVSASQWASDVYTQVIQLPAAPGLAVRASWRIHLSGKLPT